MGQCGAGTQDQEDLSPSRFSMRLVTVLAASKLHNMSCLLGNLDMLFTRQKNKRLFRHCSLVHL